MPKIGEKIYIPTSLFVYRGEDDIIGGISTIKSIENKHNCIMVEVNENKGTFYNYKVLLEEQEELKKEFGNKKAKKQPDNRPEFNDNGADWH